MPIHLTSTQRGAALGLLGTGLLLWAFFQLFPLSSFSLSSYLLNPMEVMALLPLLLLVSINGLALVKRLPTWLVVLRFVFFFYILLLFLVVFLMALPWFCGDYGASGCHLFTPDFFLFLLINPFFESCLWGFFLNSLGLFIVYRRSRSDSHLPA